MSPHASLDIIVPCYNPANGWEHELAQGFEAFCELVSQPDARLILVNDGSTQQVEDAHIEYLRGQIANFHYISYAENMGKGHALRQGVEAATAPLMLYTDIDFPYTLDSMRAIYQQLQQDSDVTLGFRNTNYYEKVPWFRKQLSKFLRWMLRNVLGLAITDTQCGLKGFNQKGKAVFLKTTINRFLFDLEFVKAISSKRELTATPVPVQLRDDIEFSRVDLRILIREAFNFFLLLFKQQQ